MNPSNLDNDFAGAYPVEVLAFLRQPPQREFRCFACGRKDRYQLARFSLVQPICCGQPMRAGAVVTVPRESIGKDIDLVRLRTDQAWRRQENPIYENWFHANWTETWEVWLLQTGRFWGGSRLALLGKTDRAWEYDLGRGVPDPKRIGSGRTREEAIARMLAAAD